MIATETIQLCIDKPSDNRLSDDSIMELMREVLTNRVALENFKDAMQGIGHIQRTLNETFGGLHGTHVEPDVIKECKAICDAIHAAYVRNDDARRMTWLCSKTVEVRDPLFYGSHHMFYAQCDSDDDENYHTTLREQVDKAIALEHPVQFDIDTTNQQFESLHAKRLPD